MITGAMQEFINYAVLGIKTFSNKIPYKRLLNSSKIYLRVLAVIVPSSIMAMATWLIIAKILKKDSEKIQNLLTILIYSLSIIIVMYPISDEIHFLIGSVISIIGFIYMIYIISKKIYDKTKLKKKYKIYKILTLIIWLIIFSLIATKTIDNIYKYIKIEKNTEIEHYKNIEIKEYLKQRIDNLNKYILEKEQEGKAF